VNARLILQHVTKVFPGREAIRAVHDLTLTAERGELLVLLGPSGCGKTTTLRLIAGLEKPTSGRIFLGGEAIDDKSPRERHVAMAFQYPALLPQLNVFQNLALGLRLRGLDEDDTSARIRTISEALGITALLGRKPETLSGGQQQRVALGRALITEPRLFLLDEPLANLDPITRADLRGLIRSVQQELRTTMLYVTHDQHEAAALGDRIAILNRGRLEQIGTAAQIYSNPANLFVARFFGPHELNLLPGAIDSAGFEHPSFRIALDGKHAGQPAVLAFRPDQVELDSGGLIAGEVTALEDRGWTSFARVQVGPSRIQIECKSGAGLGPVRFNPRSFFLFNLENGQRLA
jgi:multiple sugar transport system ATP-binding protein